MRRCIGALAISIGCLAALAITPALGASRPKVWQARFQATAQGTEKTTWTLHHTANPTKNACDTNDGTGNGSQTVTYRTITPMTAHVIGVGNGEPMLAPIRGVARSILVSGSMTRNSKAVWTHAPGAPESVCGSGDEGTAPPKPDCGTKPLGRWWLGLEYSRRNVLSLTRSSGMQFAEPPEFQHCVLYGPDRFGLLPVEKRLPETKLRAAARGATITLSGDEKESERHADYDWQATLHWVVTLKRIK